MRQSSSAEGATREQSTPAVIDYNSIAGRMEVIQPKDVSLVKYLGSGGYGEVYLGKWHSSEAAIKCLNPSLFFNAGQVWACTPSLPCIQTMPHTSRRRCQPSRALLDLPPSPSPVLLHQGTSCGKFQSFNKALAVTWWLFFAPTAVGSNLLMMTDVLKPRSHMCCCLPQHDTHLQVSQAAITELIREADLLGSLRHPNVVWVYGVVLPSPTGDDSSDEDSDDSSADAARMPSSAAQQQGKGSVPGSVRPPAIVTEFMSQGSLKGALQRKADIVQGSLMRVLIAMDAAKVRPSVAKPHTVFRIMSLNAAAVAQQRQEIECFDLLDFLSLVPYKPQESKDVICSQEK